MAFHIIPETGVPAKCPAKMGKCPYKEETQHFDNKKEAMEYFEKSMKNRSFKSMYEDWNMAPDIARLQILNEIVDLPGPPAIKNNFSLALSRLEYANTEFFQHKKIIAKNIEEMLPLIKKQIDALEKNKTPNNLEIKELVDNFYNNLQSNLDRMKEGKNPIIIRDSNDDFNFIKKPSSKTLMKEYNEIINSLPLRNKSTISPSPPTGVKEMFKTFNKVKTKETFENNTKAFSERINLCWNHRNGQNNGHFTRGRVEEAVNQVFPDGKFFRKKFGGIDYASNEEYISRLRKLMTAMSETLD